MSKEQRPVCPKCGKPLVYQPSIKSYRCNPDSTTYDEEQVKPFATVEIDVPP